MSASAEPFEWTPFMRGFVFWETPQAEFNPPDPDDAADLAERLAGFRQAYADYPDTLDPNAGESLSEALDRLLVGHPALLTLKMMLRPV
jgi:hypothetical protein